jgi:hypothetical protein
MSGIRKATSRAKEAFFSSLKESCDQDVPVEEQLNFAEALFEYFQISCPTAFEQMKRKDEQQKQAVMEQREIASREEENRLLAISQDNDLVL